MPDALLPVLLAAAGLVALAGVLKLRSGRPVVGAGELALGLAVVLAPGPGTAGALALAYLVFAAVAAYRARRGEGCGCFGEEDEEPAGGLHVGIDLALALAAGLAVLAPPAGLAAQPVGVAAVLLLAAGATTWALHLALTVLPGLWRAWDEAPG